MFPYPVLIMAPSRLEDLKPIEYLSTIKHNPWLLRELIHFRFLEQGVSVPSMVFDELLVHVGGSICFLLLEIKDKQMMGSRRNRILL